MLIEWSWNQTKVYSVRQWSFRTTSTSNLLNLGCCAVFTMKINRLLDCLIEVNMTCPSPLPSLQLLVGLFPTRISSRSTPRSQNFPCHTTRQSGLRRASRAQCPFTNHQGRPWPSPVEAILSRKPLNRRQQRLPASSWTSCHSDEQNWSITVP